MNSKIAARFILEDGTMILVRKSAPETEIERTADDLRNMNVKFKIEFP